MSHILRLGLLGMVEQEPLQSGDVGVLTGHFGPVEEYLADEGLVLLLGATPFKPLNFVE